MPLTLGRRSSAGASYFEGRIKDLQFYRCLLTPEQIAAAYVLDLSPMWTPTPLPMYCPSSPPSRIQVNTRARVTPSAAGEIREDLRVRATAGGERIRSMAAGTEFRVIGGHTCIDDRTWW